MLLTMKGPFELSCLTAGVLFLACISCKNPADMKITGFEPKTGPTSGGTTIEITGRNLRSVYTEATADLVIRIGKSKPVVLSWQNELIVCRTEETSIEIASPIRVHFISKNPDNEGKILQTNLRFQLLKPIINQFEPKIRLSPFSERLISLGQKGKDIEVVIRGQNLNVGNKRMVELWSGECAELTNDGAVMICLLVSFKDPKHMSDIDRNTLRIRIDAWTGSLLGKLDGFIDMFGDYGRFLKKEGRSKGEKVLIIIGIIVLTAIPVMIVIVFLVRRLIRHKANESLMHFSMAEARKTQHEARNEIIPKSVDKTERVSLMEIVDEADMASLFDLNKIIAIEHLTLEEEIGKGHFGLVFKGTLHDSKSDQRIDVAVKTVIQKSKDVREVSAFFQEAMIMRDFEHPHILNLIGVSFSKDQGLPLVVVPFMANGDMREYIMNERLPLLLAVLMQMAIDVARGMSYLEFNKVVHRDLAARNCLLDHNLSVRVSDFGLSRDVYQSDYYRAGIADTDLPLRWMALECIDFHKYSSKSDVWSYGVLVWELMTRGKVPYADIDKWEIGTFLKCDKRLEKPDSCPPFLYDIMTRCWLRDPDERPTFADLVKLIPLRWQETEAMTDSEIRQYENAKRTYENETK